jgi:hypothetical protein
LQICIRAPAGYYLELLLLLPLLGDKAPSLSVLLVAAAVAADLHEQCICNNGPVEYQQSQQVHTVDPWARLAGCPGSLQDKRQG